MSNLTNQQCEEKLIEVSTLCNDDEQCIRQKVTESTELSQCMMRIMAKGEEALQSLEDNK